MGKPFGQAPNRRLFAKHEARIGRKTWRRQPAGHASAAPAINVHKAGFEAAEQALDGTNDAEYTA